MQIAALLCLAAAANAAAVLPLESSVVKSDRVGDNFSYSIHQNHGYAVSPDVKSVVQSVVPSVEVKQHQVVPSTYVAAQPAVVSYAHQPVVPSVEVKQHQVVPSSYVGVHPVVPYAQQSYVPYEVKSHVVPASTAYIAQQPVVSVAEQVVPASTAYLAQQPVVQVKSQFVSPVQVKSQFVSPVQVKATEYKSVVPVVSSYVQPYVSSVYPYATYGSVSYPVVKADKYVK